MELSLLLDRAPQLVPTNHLGTAIFLAWEIAGTGEQGRGCRRSRLGASKEPQPSSSWCNPPCPVDSQGSPPALR